MPVVSVCLPVFNGAKYLSKAIQSTLDQTFEDLELIIIDDCSTDETSSIIERFAAEDKRVKSYANKENLKLFGNYNACIGRANGKYIKLLAHDDLLQPTLIANMVSVLESNANIGLVSCSRRWIDASENAIEADSALADKLMRPFLVNTRLASSEAITSTLVDVMNWLGEPSSQMFRREQADGGFDVSFRQIGDLEYSYRLLKNGDYYFLADDFCYLRRHSEDWSTARSVDPVALMDWFLLGSKYKSYIDSIDLSSEAYCLNVIKALTNNFESNMHGLQKLDREGRGALLRKLCGERDPLSYFNCQRNAERELANEFQAMAMISFLHNAILENELRLINKELARSYTDLDADGSEKIRSGIARALLGMKNTMIERDKEIAALKSKLTEIGTSLSWKLTEPLRVLIGRIR